MNFKQISFAELKTNWARRLIDLDRQITLLSNVLNMGEYLSDELKEEAEVSMSNKIDERNLIKSLQRRTSGNDTIEIIQRQMKAKALRDIDKWENRSETD